MFSVFCSCRVLAELGKWIVGFQNILSISLELLRTSLLMAPNTAADGESERQSALSSTEKMGIGQKCGNLLGRWALNDRESAACKGKSEAARLRYGEEKAKREVCAPPCSNSRKSREEEGCQHPHPQNARTTKSPDARGRESRMRYGVSRPRAMGVGFGMQVQQTVAMPV